MNFLYVKRCLFVQFASTRHALAETLWGVFVHTSLCSLAFLHWSDLSSLATFPSHKYMIACNRNILH